jgi:prostaglandin-H2 D-isomerase / glutathione transferase
VAGGILFKDTRISGEDFAAMKADGRLPFNQLPVMAVDGQTIAQSGAILRYCGKLSGLYSSKDNILAAKTDEVLGFLDDFMGALFKQRGAGEEVVRTGRKEFVAKTGPAMLGGLEGVLEQNKASSEWMCGSSLTIADLGAYVAFGNVMNGFVDHVPTNLFDKYPRIMASYNAVCKHPKLASWIKDHPWK